ncbi:MAG: cell envelope integrity protein TolA [Campylobacterota bacterium]|nr:cell envelope integrity protein TolA [Campylobacterota bacterium]
MVRNNSLFYLSGFVSFLLFFSVLFLFSYLVIINELPKSFALKKDKFIKVSVDLTEAKPFKKQKKQVKIKKESIVKKQKIKEEPLATPADFSSLFSNVKAKKIVYKKQVQQKQKIDTAQIKQIQKRIKTTSKRDSVASKAIESLEISKSSDNTNSKSVSTASQINALAAKITEIIYSRFLVDTSMLGNIVTIRISIDSSGKLTQYRIIQTSSSEALNEEAILLEKRLLHVTFPRTKDYKPYSLKFNLIPEDK